MTKASRDQDPEMPGVEAYMQAFLVIGPPPNLVDMLVRTFEIRPIGAAEADVEARLVGV